MPIDEGEGEDRGDIAGFVAPQCAPGDQDVGQYAVKQRHDTRSVPTADGPAGRSPRLACKSLLISGAPWAPAIGMSTDLSAPGAPIDRWFLPNGTIRGVRSRQVRETSCNSLIFQFNFWKAQRPPVPRGRQQLANAIRR
jgi:hypothetical protein